MNKLILIIVTVFLMLAVACGSGNNYAIPEPTPEPTPEHNPFVSEDSHDLWDGWNRMRRVFDVDLNVVCYTYDEVFECLQIDISKTNVDSLTELVND